MEHVVFFPGPDAPGFRRFASRDEAVRFVEQLRNVDGVSDVSLYAMTPVPLVVRTYYRVEVPAVDDAVLPTVPEQADGGGPRCRGRPCRSRRRRDTVLQSRCRTASCRSLRQRSTTRSPRTVGWARMRLSPTPAASASSRTDRGDTARR